MAVPMTEETFRSSFGRLLAGSIIAIGATIAAAALLEDGPRAVLVVWPWVGLVGLLSWTLYWYPQVVVTPGGVKVVNPFRTIDLPWPAIDDIDTRWALTLMTTFGTFRAWAAPAPGPLALRRLAREDTRVAGRKSGEVVRPSDLPISDSGAAALVVRQRWERLRDAGYLDDARVEFDTAPVRWHVEIIAGCAALGALAAIGLAVA